MIMVMHMLLYSSLRVHYDLYRFLQRWMRVVVVEVRLYWFVYGWG
jgi:hypothetical protein